jgi:diguanylate cyclase (GGDEF)-like protein
MMGSGTEDALFLLLSIFSLIASVVNFIILFVFLRIQEKQNIHRLFLLQNASLLTFSTGILGFVNTVGVANKGLTEWHLRILSLSFLTVCCIGFIGASIDWFHIAACYAGKDELAKGQRRNLAHIPIGLVIAALWAYFLFDKSSGLEPINAVYNLTAILSTGVAIVFILLASKLYIQTALKSGKKISKGMALISVIPVIGGGLSLSSLFFKFEYSSSLIITIQSISFLIANALLALGLFRTGHLKLMPAAIQKVFYNLNEVVLVLDQYAKITYFNSLTHEIFPNIHIGIAINELGYQLDTKLQQFQKDASISTNFELNIKGLIYRVRILQVESNEQVIGWIITLTDISKRKHIEEQLLHNTLHDHLTNLPNCNLLVDRLNHAIQSAQRDNDYKFAVLSIDLDRFRYINDNHGRQAGDQVLIEVGNRLTKCLRKIDTIARMEGDEFVILLERISGVRAATEVSLRALELLPQAIKVNEQDIFPSISIGIAMGSRRYKEADEILRDANIALEQAKKRGKSQYVIFDKEMQAHVASLYQLEIDLHQALPNNQFKLFYQPILALPGKGILGFEALLRWDHPEHGLMLPGEFLPEADEPELILPIGYWGIEQACQDLFQWSSHFPPESPMFVTINLFTKQLLDPELPEVILTILQKTRVIPLNLGLEIKESVIINDDPQILDAIKHLKSIGIKILVDDFGAGYSSLRTLPIYPIDFIKIAPSLIRNVSRSTDDYEAVQFITELAQKLGMEVIAQGIEYPHELIEIESIKCDQGQGSYFCKPIEQDEVEHLLNQINHKHAENKKIDHKKII